MAQISEINFLTILESEKSEIKKWPDLALELCSQLADGHLRDVLSHGLSLVCLWGEEEGAVLLGFFW